jgi:hypothetical protein
MRHLEELSVKFNDRMEIFSNSISIFNLPHLIKLSIVCADADANEFD